MATVTMFGLDLAKQVSRLVMQKGVVPEYCERHSGNI